MSRGTINHWSCHLLVVQLYQVALIVILSRLTQKPSPQYLLIIALSGLPSLRLLNSRETGGGQISTGHSICRMAVVHDSSVSTECMGSQLSPSLEKSCNTTSVDRSQHMQHNTAK